MRLLAFLSFIAMIISLCTSIITKTDYAAELGSGAISYGVMQATAIIIYLGSILLFYDGDEETINTQYLNKLVIKNTSKNNHSLNDNSDYKIKDNNKELVYGKSKSVEFNDDNLKVGSTNQSVIKSDNVVSSKAETIDTINDKSIKYEVKDSKVLSGLKEYKVLSKKDKWFNGKFDVDLLENALNSYARQGWKVVSAFSADIIGIIGPASKEAIIILERDVD